MRAKLSVHRDQFSEKDLVVNPKHNLKLNDIIGIVLMPSNPNFQLLVQVEDLREEIKCDCISLSENIIRRFQISHYGSYEVERKNPVDVTLESIELVYKDQYLSRYDQYRFYRRLIGCCMYQKKAVNFSHIRCHVHSMCLPGGQSLSGYVNEQTKVIFRSVTAKIFLFLQISSDLWEYDERSGDLYYEKMVNGFLSDLFDKWRLINCQHYVSVTLFARMIFKDTFKPAAFISDKHDLRQDPLGRYYIDFYKVVYQYEQKEDWRMCLPRIRNEIYAFQIDIVEDLNRSIDPYIFSPISFYLSDAADGNLLEALNHAANVFEIFNSNRLMDNLGHFCIVATASNGVFNVERDLFCLKMEYLLSN